MLKFFITLTLSSSVSWPGQSFTSFASLASFFTPETAGTSTPGKLSVTSQWKSQQPWSDWRITNSLVSNLKGLLTLIRHSFCTKFHAISRFDLFEGPFLISGVNFINILRVHFLYESLLCSFSLLRVWLWTNFCTKNVP